MNKFDTRIILTIALWVNAQVEWKQVIVTIFNRWRWRRWWWWWCWRWFWSLRWWRWDIEFLCPWNWQWIAVKLMERKPLAVYVCQITFDKRTKNSNSRKQLHLQPTWYTAKLNAVCTSSHPILLCLVYFFFSQTFFFLLERYNLTVIWTHCAYIPLLEFEKLTFGRIANGMMVVWF